MFIMLVFLCNLVTACAGAEEVVCSSSNYEELMGTYHQKWDEIIRVSLTRFPGVLDPVISDLEGIMGEYQKLEIPEHPACCATGKCS